MSRARSLADLISGNAIIEGAEIATSTITNDRLVSAGQLTLGSTALTLGATTTAIAGLTTISVTDGTNTHVIGNKLKSPYFGFEALSSNTTGNYNVAIGDSALKANTVGIANTYCISF